MLTLNEENVNEKEGYDEGDENEQDILEENEEEENIPEEDFEEEEIVRAKDNRHIYIRKVLKSTNLADSSQPNRKLDRVYNQKHCCFLCKKMILHLPCHFKSKHRNDPEIKDALMKTDKRRFDKLRAKGDNMHNELVLKEGKGELIISRRPVEFQVIDFAPCSICYEWMNMKYIDKHHKKLIQKIRKDLPWTLQSFEAKKLSN